MAWMTWVAWLAAVLVFATFFMKTIVPLRTMAIISNVAFIVYGLLGLGMDIFAKVAPILVLHCSLLPLNVLRLLEVQRSIRAVRSMQGEQGTANFLTPYMTRSRHRAGSVLFSRGDPADRVYVLGSGTVRIVEFDRKLAPGDLFGDVMLSYKGPNVEYAEVISERATFYSISQEQLAMLMRSNHNLTMNYMAKVSEKFKSLESRYLNMVTKDVKSRLLYCFREWARKEGKSLGNSVVVKNSLTHSDLANLISTSRQTVTVILNELKESGAINYNRREIHFNDLVLAN